MPTTQTLDATPQISIRGEGANLSAAILSRETSGLLRIPVVLTSFARQGLRRFHSLEGQGFCFLRNRTVLID